MAYDGVIETLRRIERRLDDIERRVAALQSVHQAQATLPRLLTVSEVAAALKLSKATVHAWLKTGQLKCAAGFKAGK